MTRTLLVLGAGVYYVRTIAAARATGYRLVVLDRDPDAPGFALADVALPVDFADSEKVLDVARRERVDGVMAINDFGVPAAAYVAETLGLVGLSRETARLAMDKGLMRERWRRDGLASPDFRVVDSADGAKAAAEELGLPLVLKPANSGGGGRGVSIVKRDDELQWAYDFAFAPARDGRVVVERFLDGVELTVEAIAYEGDVHVLAVSDKVRAPLRTCVATSLRYPAALAAEQRAAVERLAADAVASLGVADGPVHVEIMMTAAGPMLVEMGARGGGGHLFSTIVEAVSGVPMVREAARVLVGETPDLTVRRQAGCVYWLFTPQRGVIREVRGIEEARAMPGVLDIHVIRRPGDVVGDLTDSLQRSGFAVVAGRDRDEAIARAEAVAATVVFVLDPLPEDSPSPHA